MANSALEWISIGLGFAALVGIGLLWLRARPNGQPKDSAEVRADIERLERAIQVNDKQSFANAEARAEALRKEVAGNIQLFADQVAKSVALVGDSQKAQFESFEKMLTGQVKSVDERLARLIEQQKTALDGFVNSSVENARLLRDEIANRLKSAADDLRTASETAAKLQKEKLEEVAARLTGLSEGLGAGFEKFQQATETSLKGLATETAESMKALRTDNEQKLEQMRVTVDEKLHDTLEKRLGEQFALVVTQLKAVHEGLGDMQRLATGVGDLKRVLTNVKVRGTWTEIRLASILEEMLAPDEYERNVKVKDGSSEVVEFCIKIPKAGESGEPLLLPLDAKFPTEDYERLIACAEAGDAAGVEASAQKLEARFRACAKDISTKYVAPPRTTEYAIMYVPFEGLYAEIVKRPGLASEILRNFNVVIAGPTNLMSIVSAVQAIIRSVAVQQRAGQIGALLLSVQHEFGKFAKAVDVAKKRAQSTVSAMDSLDRRQRVLGKTLNNVKAIEADLPAAHKAVDLVSYAVADDEEDGQGAGELAEIDDELNLGDETPVSEPAIAAE